MVETTFAHVVSLTWAIPPSTHTLRQSMMGKYYIEDLDTSKAQWRRGRQTSYEIRLITIENVLEHKILPWATARDSASLIGWCSADWGKIIHNASLILLGKRGEKRKSSRRKEESCECKASLREIHIRHEQTYKSSMCEILDKADDADSQRGMFGKEKR